LSYMTRLEDFMTRNGVKPMHLAKKAGISRQHLLRVRKGTADPARPTIKALTMAMCRLLGRDVHASDLFDLGDDPR